MSDKREVMFEVHGIPDTEWNEFAKLVHDTDCSVTWHVYTDAQYKILGVTPPNGPAQTFCGDTLRQCFDHAMEWLRVLARNTREVKLAAARARQHAVLEACEAAGKELRAAGYALRALELTPERCPAPSAGA